jgi:hypothetical protein
MAAGLGRVAASFAFSAARVGSALAQIVFAFATNSALLIGALALNLVASPLPPHPTAHTPSDRVAAIAIPHGRAGRGIPMFARLRLGGRGVLMGCLKLVAASRDQIGPQNET